MLKPIVIIGAGGHAQVALAALRAVDRIVLACTTLNPEHLSAESFGCSLLTDEALIQNFTPADIELVLGIGSITPEATSGKLTSTVAKFSQIGFEFTGFRHPAAWIAPNAVIAKTAQIHAGAIVQPNARIGEFSIINTRSSVDHDCVVDDFCHIAPGVTLSGNVQIDKGSHLGTGCSVIQNVKIGSNVLVAAGSVVTKNVPNNTRVKGIPARTF